MPIHVFDSFPSTKNSATYYSIFPKYKPLKTGGKLKLICINPSVQPKSTKQAINGPQENTTLEGSTFCELLTTETTRSVTSDLSRKDPLTSSDKWRRSRLPKEEKRLKLGLWVIDRTFTLRCFRIKFLTAMEEEASLAVVASLSRTFASVDWIGYSLDSRPKLAGALLKVNLSNTPQLRKN